MTPDRLNFVGLTRHRPNPKQQMAGLAAVPESVDLWNAGTFRGDQPAPLQAVSLPVALVKVTIILPRYSDPGRYAVAVTRDQGGNDLLARPAQPQRAIVTVKKSPFTSICGSPSLGAISFQRPMSRIRLRTTTLFKSGSQSSEVVLFQLADHSGVFVTRSLSAVSGAPIFRDHRWKHVVWALQIRPFLVTNLVEFNQLR